MSERACRLERAPVGPTIAVPHYVFLRTGLACLIGSDSVGGQRGTVVSSDPPEIPSGGFVKTALFQPPRSEPDRCLSTHPALQA